MKKRHVILLDLMLLVVITLLIFFLPNIILFAKQQMLTTLLRPNRVATIELAIGPDAGNSQVFTAKEQVIISRSNLMEAYDRSGKLIWKRDLFGENTHVYSGKDTLLIGELSRGDLAIVDNKNAVLAEIKDLGKIEQVLRREDDFVAVLLAGKNEIRIYDGHLKQQAVVKVPYGQIVSMKFAHAEDLLMVYTTKVADYSFESYVLQYNMQGEIVASSDCKDLLIYDMQMYDNLVLVGNNEVSSFSREAQLVNTIDTPGFIDYSIAYKNRLYLSVIATEGENQGVNQLVVMNDILSTLKTINMPEAIGGLSVNDAFIATYANGVVTLYDHGFKEVSKTHTNIAIKQFLWVSDYTFLVQDEHEVLLYQIK